MSVFDFASPLPERLYWDSSFILNFSFAAAKFHEPCTTYYARLKEERVPVLLSNLALDETWFILMKLETQQLYHPKSFWEIYREEPEQLTPVLQKIRDFTTRLTQLRHVTLVGTAADAYKRALQAIESNTLLPRDAYHWSIMQNHDLTAIATTDADFMRLSDSRVYTCNQKILDQHQE